MRISSIGIGNNVLMGFVEILLMYQKTLYVRLNYMMTIYDAGMCSHFIYHDLSINP